MTGAVDILDLIDAAVTDWKTSPDAVRYNASSWGGWTPTTFILDEVAQYWHPTQQWSCIACGSTWAGGPTHECTWTPLDAASEHRMRVQLLRAFRVRPHEIGIGDMGCACHPAPFPAARDYRRRTKHRNRRRCW